MKIEIELHPGVNVEDPEVQKLLKKLEEIRPQEDFRQGLMRRFADTQVDAAIVAFSDLVQSIELKGPPDIYREEVEEFKREILSRLK